MTECWESQNFREFNEALAQGRFREVELLGFSNPGFTGIRVETIDYFLRRYRDEVIRKRKAGEEIEAQLAALETELRGPMVSRFNASRRYRRWPPIDYDRLLRPISPRLPPGAAR